MATIVIDWVAQSVPNGFFLAIEIIKYRFHILYPTAAERHPKNDFATQVATLVQRKPTLTTTGTLVVATFESEG